MRRTVHRTVQAIPGPARRAGASGQAVNQVTMVSKALAEGDGLDFMQRAGRKGKPA